MVHYTEAEALGQGPLMGSSFSILLYGVISMQTYLYFQNYQSDSRLIKSIVALIWSTETIHTGFSIFFVHHYFIANFADLVELGKIEWSVPLSTVIGLLIGWVVNVFFVWRMWLLSRKPWLPLIALVLASARAALGIYVCHVAFLFNTWKSFGPQGHPYLVAALATEVVANTVITGTVSYELLKGRSGIRQTDALVNRLLIYTVNTGAITSVVAVGELVSLLAVPHSNVFLAFVFVQSKLYANCLLATLNARKAMRQQTALGLSTPNHRRDITLKSAKFSDPSRTMDTQASNNGIEICTETVVAIDNSSSHSGKNPRYSFGPEKPPSLTSYV